MRDWIVGLQKAASEVRGGATASDWENVTRELGRDAPEELHELYGHFNGAWFASGVTLFPLESSGSARGVIELSHLGAAGFPSEDVWHFGQQNDEQLAAIRRHRLSDVEHEGGMPSPKWLEARNEDAWVYIARDVNANTVRLYPSLEQMLTARIPPAASEDFGDRTYARALMLVEGALTELGASSNPEAVENVLEVVRTAGAATKRADARRATAAKKQALKQKKTAPAKKTPAAKKPAAGAKKAAPAKKTAAAKKPAAGAKKASPAKKKPAVKRPAAGARKTAPAKKSPAAKKPAPTKKPAAKKGPPGRKPAAKKATSKPSSAKKRGRK